MASLDVAIRVPRRDFALDLEITAGPEPLAIAGPTGAGKSTLLKAIAGLVTPKLGHIRVDDRVWFDSEARVNLPPEDRRVGLVFQEYALFPHMTVRDNVAFGGRAQADKWLERFGLTRLAGTKPTELSGGERQYVALARALAREPDVLLLDEPTAALDPALRAEVRGELRSILRELSIPTIVVTHDFQEAATLTPRVGVLVEGNLLQVGAPTELVASPAHPYVATFTGANILAGHARPTADGLTEIALEEGQLLYSTDQLEGAVGAVVYPWDISLSSEPPRDSSLNHFTGTVVSIVGLGNRVRVRVGPLSAEITAASAIRLGIKEGSPVVASFKATATRLIGLDRGVFRAGLSSPDDRSLDEG
ncbi:MAG TPA: ABC transporter ATP-binding protein [Actinomycetota bacterium]|nr:ABC transporter ATP-binding protein [Actinomycetota bacterium]